MSKNKYSLPFKNKWYVEFGGIKKEDSHSWDNILQRYAYDFEIRKDNLPYHDDLTKVENYYSYLEEIIAPCDGVVVDIEDKYEDTHIDKNRKIICDCDDVRGNYIIIKHKNNEYSLIAHIKKGTFKVKFGDNVKCGDVVALVGNSGNSNGPHIHFHVQNSLDYNNAIGIPITFKNITVEKDNKKKRHFLCHIKMKSYVSNSSLKY